MKKIKAITKVDIALLIGIILTILISSVCSAEESQKGISEKVVRLHILANSDTEEDQALKLKVRDEILFEAENIFTDGESQLEAEQIIVDNIETIKAIAQRVITENGYSYSVDCQLTHMYFDEKVYDSLTLPAGDYDALRIEIGNADGHNWWCVMYPAYCVAPSIESDELSTFNSKEIKIMKQPKKYKVKFKCVDIYKKVKKFFK